MNCEFVGYAILHAKDGIPSEAFAKSATAMELRRQELAVSQDVCIQKVEI